MDRRAFIAASAVTPLVSLPVPASETQIMGLFREWQSAEKYLIKQTEDDALDSACDFKQALEFRLSELPSTCLSDLAVKFIAFSRDGSFDLDGPIAENVTTEIRRLAGLA